MPQQPLGRKIRSDVSTRDRLMDDIQRGQPQAPPPMPSPALATAPPMPGGPQMSPEAAAFLAMLMSQVPPEMGGERSEQFPLTPALAERGVTPSMRALQTQGIGRR